VETNLKDRVITSLNIKNTFNSIQHNQLYNRLLVVNPSIFPFFNWKYGGEVIDDGNIMTTAFHDDTIIDWITPRFEAIGLALKINKSTVVTHPECLIRFSTIQQTAVGT
jgi:hypothetical protein